jgi:hypothetical protein
MRPVVPKGLVRYALAHPGSWWPLIVSAWRLRRARWWRQWPLLPVPDPAYWDFRMTTAFGTAGGPASPRAVVDAARWSIRQRVGR